MIKKIQKNAVESNIKKELISYSKLNQSNILK